MEQILYNATRLIAGINTEQAETENGDAYFYDMRDLRVNGRGHLQVREAIESLSRLQGNGTLTGIAASPEGYLFSLRGQELYVTDIQTGNSTRLVADVNLQGRLSLVSAFEDYHILTSEGPDQGYLVDLSDSDTLTIYQLGIAPPERIHFFSGSADPINANFPPLQENRIYVFRLSFGRLFTDRFDILRRNIRAGKLPRVYENVESNLSPPVIYRIGQTSGIGTSFVDTAGNTYPVIEPPTSNRRVFFTIHSFPPAIVGANGVLLYQSEPIVANEQRTYNVDDLTYRLVDFQPFDANTSNVTLHTLYEFSNTVADDNIPGWQEQPEFADGKGPKAYERLPATTKTLFFYNDRVWAPQGDALRYSEVEFGNLQTWTYPPQNSIRRPSRIDFAGSFNETLLFGGEDGLWRLTGTDAYNFQIGRLSSQGPLDGYAWEQIKQGLAFLSQKSIHVTDTVQVLKISQPLDDLFLTHQIEQGSVLYLPDERNLYALKLKNILTGDTEWRTYIVRERWESWDTQIEQICRYEANSTTRIEYADSTTQAKRIHWDTVAGEIDTATAWQLATQQIAGDGAGIGEDNKRFKSFEIAGTAVNPITVTAFIKNRNDQVSEVARELTLGGTRTRRAKIAINRIGISCQVKIQGTGPCELRGLRLLADV